MPKKITNDAHASCTSSKLQIKKENHINYMSQFHINIDVAVVKLGLETQGGKSGGG